jgi:hypothetical protein
VGGRLGAKTCPIARQNRIRAIAQRPTAADQNPVPQQTNRTNGHRPPPGDEPDPRDEIARLEAEIEERSEAIERCRKVILVSKIAAAGGALAIILLLLGIIPSNATLLIISIAAVLGGLVGLGSTTTTAGQLAEAVKNAEARRAALIGTISLTVVGDEPSRH